MATVKIISGLTIAVIIAGIALNLYQPKLTEETKEKLAALAKRGLESAKKLFEKKPRGGESVKPLDVLVEEDDARTEANEPGSKDRLLTAEELSEYDGGADSRGMYLAILGKVYDVEKGAQHYRPGGGYAFFTGRDASRAYVTGDFTEEGLTDDVLDLKSDQLLGIQEWLQFYEKEYRYVGKLIGRFYDQNGVATDYLSNVEASLEDGRAMAQDEVDLRKIFPPCNSEWSHDLGGKVWCSNMSGGVEREWAGVPRKFYQPGQDNPRCVCVRNMGQPTAGSTGKQSDSNSSETPNGLGRGDLDHPHLREYDDCHPDEDNCKI